MNDKKTSNVIKLDSFKSLREVFKKDSTEVATFKKPGHEPRGVTRKPVKPNSDGVA